MRQDNYERLQERSRREFGNRQGTGGENQADYNRPQNLGSAQSDYGDRAYGGRANEQGENRGWLEKAGDEVSSWFGGGESGNRRDQNQGYGGNENEYDNNSYHSYQGGYTPKEANPFYPTTNRIYERNTENRENRDEAQNRNYQSNQDQRSNQQRGFYSAANQGGQQNRENREENRGENRGRGFNDTRAGDMMTRNVSTVHPNDTAQRAARLMRDEDCGALPVVDRQGRMIGMVTDRDITIRLVADGADPRYAQVQDCMTDEVFACHVNDPIEGCIRAMRQHQVRRMPVVNDRNQILGIISQGDLARLADRNRDRGGRHAFTDFVSEISEPTSDSYR